MPFKRPFWIRFDKEDREKQAPEFCLPSIQGDVVCLRHFQGRRCLLLYFGSDIQNPLTLKRLRSFSKYEEAYAAVHAQPMVIFSEGSEQIAAQKELSALPLILLSDPKGNTRKNYAALMEEDLVSPGDDLLFILDEMGAPYAAAVGAEQADASLHDKALEWLEIIEVFCPE